MPIHFSCVKCGKKMFAQERFAGRAVLCPDCQTSNAIPAVAAAAQPEGGLIDMERTRPDSGDATPVTPVESKNSAAETALSAEIQGPQTISGSPPAPAPPAQPGAEDATRLCPICAERIKVLAKKCRFCGAIFDEGLRQEQGLALDAMQRLLAERSVRTWRVVARAATGLTIGWLIFVLFMIAGRQDVSVPAVIFNVLLLSGLFISMRQMKDGPYHVFLAAALAVSLSMPILSQLGFMPFDAEVYQQLAAMYKDDPRFRLLSQEQHNQMFWSFTSMAGIFCAIPVWIAAANVAALKRLRSPRK